MSEFNQNSLVGDQTATDQYIAVVTPRMMQKISLAVAIVASAISLGVAVCAGLHLADSVDEQVWSVAMALVSVVCLHLAPMLCRFVSLSARFILGVLWLLAACVVLRGQMDVLAFANMHAAGKRAQSVATVVVPPVATESSGRGLTAIAQDIATVSIDVAHVEARRCMGECRTLRKRKAELSAQLTSLNAEADEARRRATEQDWLRDQAGRAQEFRESRRPDPATSLVAHWLGTTEARLNTLLDFVCVVVLEGVACFAWYFAALRPVVVGRTAISFDGKTTLPQHESVAPVPDVMSGSRVEWTDGHAAGISVSESIAKGLDGNPAMSEDDLLVAKIHEAVVAGRLTRNLASIRKFLQCGQRKAARLNSLYIDRFGKARSQARQGDQVRAT
ncbi:hypothetical protein [Paraburkholderia sp.]|uniref:hypothetical protein n=1 Tax=Paraburkholderia sp. TaxID=1926495 RepID=UPI003C7B8840